MEGLGDVVVTDGGVISLSIYIYIYLSLILFFFLFMFSFVMFFLFPFFNNLYQLKLSQKKYVFEMDKNTLKLMHVHSTCSVLLGFNGQFTVEPSQ